MKVLSHPYKHVGQGISFIRVAPAGRPASRTIGLALAAALVASLADTGPSRADNTASAALDWSGNYSFGGVSAAALRLQQADLIAKRKAGYYDRLGSSYYAVTNDSSTHIQQQSNSTGSVNNSETNVDFSGGNGNAFDGSNGAYSHGCQDGSIDISSVGSDLGAAPCN